LCVGLCYFPHAKPQVAPKSLGRCREAIKLWLPLGSWDMISFIYLPILCDSLWSSPCLWLLVESRSWDGEIFRYWWYLERIWDSYGLWLVFGVDHLVSYPLCLYFWIRMSIWVVCMMKVSIWRIMSPDIHFNLTIRPLELTISKMSLSAPKMMHLHSCFQKNQLPPTRKKWKLMRGWFVIAIKVSLLLLLNLNISPDSRLLLMLML
jgi:hypothetical protein